MKKRYKFISWNVNGVRAVDKKEALKWVDEHDIHILGLQETKSMKNQIQKTIFNKEFKFLTASVSAIKGRSGTALFSDIDISFECNCPTVDVLNEGRINEVHFKLKDKDIAFFKASALFSSTITLMYIFQMDKALKRDLIIKWSFMIDF